MSDGTANSGLFAALKGIAATVLAAGKTRVELFSNEIEEEKLRAIHLLLMAQGMAFCFAVGVLFAIGLLCALLWDSRLLILGLSCAFFLVLGGVFYALFKRSTQRPERVFAASIAELQQDLRELRASVSHESTAK